MGQSQKQHLLSPIKVTRTVKSSYDAKLHTLQQRGKNKFYLECDCKLFQWYKICQHGLVASVDIRISSEYLTEKKKKMRQGKGSLTGAVNTTRKKAAKKSKNIQTKRNL